MTGRLSCAKYTAATSSDAGDAERHAVQVAADDARDEADDGERR